MFVIDSSPDARSWFKEPENINHYMKYEFTSKLFISGRSNPNLEELSDKSTREKYINFLESIFFVVCRPSNPQAVMGADMEGGLHFEDLETYLNQTFDGVSPELIVNQTKPAIFFKYALADLIKNCQGFTYIDHFAFDHLFKGNRALLDFVMEANPEADIRIFSSTRNYDLPRKEIVESNLRRICAARNYRGQLTLEYANWKKNRYMILVFPNDKKLLIEFPFSLEYWDKPAFEVYKRVSFERYTGTSEDQLDPYLISTGRKKDTSVKGTIKI